MVEKSTKLDFKPVPASSKKGGSVKIQFWLMPEVKRAAEVLFKNLPYETISDLYRDAIVRHLDLLSTVTPIETDMPYIRSLIDFLGREKERIQFQLVIDELEEVVSEHEKKERHRDAKRVVRVVQEAVEKMPDGSLKDKYRQLLKNKYGYLIGGESKAEGKTEGQTDGQAETKSGGVPLDPGLMLDN